MAMTHFLPHQADRFLLPVGISMWTVQRGRKKVTESRSKMALLDSSSTLGSSDSGLSV